MRLGNAMRAGAVRRRQCALSVPWHDQAALIRTSGRSIVDGGRTIVAEGELRHLVEIASAFPAAELDRHFISLPDRRSSPHRYEGEALVRLLGRIDRPGARNFIGR